MRRLTVFGLCGLWLISLVVSDNETTAPSAVQRLYKYDSDITFFGRIPLPYKPEKFSIEIVDPKLELVAKKMNDILVIPGVKPPVKSKEKRAAGGYGSKSEDKAAKNITGSAKETPIKMYNDNSTLSKTKAVKKRYTQVSKNDCADGKCNRDHSNVNSVDIVTRGKNHNNRNNHGHYSEKNKDALIKTDIYHGRGRPAYFSAIKMAKDFLNPPIEIKMQPKESDRRIKSNVIKVSERKRVDFVNVDGNSAGRNINTSYTLRELTEKPQYDWQNTHKKTVSKDADNQSLRVVGENIAKGGGIMNHHTDSRGANTTKIEEKFTNSKPMKVNGDTRNTGKISPVEVSHVLTDPDFTTGSNYGGVSSVIESEDSLERNRNNRVYNENDTYSKYRDRPATKRPSIFYASFIQKIISGINISSYQNESDQGNASREAFRGLNSTRHGIMSTPFKMKSMTLSRKHIFHPVVSRKRLFVGYAQNHKYPLSESGRGLFRSRTVLDSRGRPVGRIYHYQSPIYRTTIYRAGSQKFPYKAINRPKWAPRTPFYLSRIWNRQPVWRDPQIRKKLQDINKLEAIQKRLREVYAHAFNKVHRLNRRRRAEGSTKPKSVVTSNKAATTPLKTTKSQVTDATDRKTTATPQVMTVAGTKQPSVKGATMENVNESNPHVGQVQKPQPMANLTLSGVPAEWHGQILTLSTILSIAAGVVICCCALAALVTCLCLWKYPSLGIGANHKPGLSSASEERMKLIGPVSSCYHARLEGIDTQPTISMHDLAQKIEKVRVRSTEAGDGCNIYPCQNEPREPPYVIRADEISNPDRERDRDHREPRDRDPNYETFSEYNSVTRRVTTGPSMQPNTGPEGHYGPSLQHVPMRPHNNSAIHRAPISYGKSQMSPTQHGGSMAHSRVALSPGGQYHDAPSLR